TGSVFVAFLREHREEILERWESSVRALPPAEHLDRRALIDHLPHILDEIADSADAALAGADAPLPRHLPDCHAIARLHQGYDLGEVVLEYSLLRKTILELSATRPNVDPEELRVFDHIFDRAIEQAVRRYAQASQRMIQAVDRFSQLAFGEENEREILR